MSSNRDSRARVRGSEARRNLFDGGADHRAVTELEGRGQLERRRAEMQAAEGHAGSIPRGNQQPEREVMGSHRIEWDRVLGH